MWVGKYNRINFTETIAREEIESSRKKGLANIDDDHPIGVLGVAGDSKNPTRISSLILLTLGC